MARGPRVRSQERKTDAKNDSANGDPQEEEPVEDPHQHHHQTPSADRQRGYESNQERHTFGDNTASDYIHLLLGYRAVMRKGLFGSLMTLIMLVAPQVAPADAGRVVVRSRPPVRQVPVREVGIVDANGDGLWRIGCLGDSNTVATFFRPEKWCEFLEEIVDDSRYQVVNLGTAGATVNPQRRLPNSTDAFGHMELAVRESLDAVVLAYGTNDLLQGYTPSEIVEAYLLHEATAAEHGIDQYFVATVPRGGPPGSSPRRPNVNQRIQSAFPGRVIEFFRGFSFSLHYIDRVHLNAAGQRLRAKRAYPQLRPRGLD